MKFTKYWSNLQHDIQSFEMKNQLSDESQYLLIFCKWKCHSYMAQLSILAGNIWCDCDDVSDPKLMSLKLDTMLMKSNFFFLTK